MEDFIERIDSKPGRGRSGTVNNWETGKNAPNKKRLKKIADLGSVSVDYLINGSQLSVANLKKLAEKIKKEDQLTNEEITKVNEALLDKKIFLKTLFDSTNQKATVKLKKQQQIIDEHPLNPFDRDLYADFVALFNLLRLTGSEQQYITFSALINFMLRIANGNMEYDKEDLLPNIDKLLSSFPVKKDQVPFSPGIDYGTDETIMVPPAPYCPNGLRGVVPRYHEKQLICLASYVEKMQSTFYIYVYTVNPYSPKGLGYYVEMQSFVLLIMYFSSPNISPVPLIHAQTMDV